MAASQIHNDSSVQHAGLREPDAGRRAKPLPRTTESSQHVRAVRAACGGQALAAAIAAAGSSNYAVARALGVDERVVREVIAGISPLTFERIRACPPTVRRALLTHELALLDEEAVPTSIDPVHATLRALRDGGDLAASAEEAARDKVYTPVEIEDLERKALKLETSARIVRLATSARRGGGT